KSPLRTRIEFCRARPSFPKSLDCAQAQGGGSLPVLRCILHSDNSLRVTARPAHCPELFSLCVIVTLLKQIKYQSLYQYEYGTAPNYKCAAQNHYGGIRVGSIGNFHLMPRPTSAA